VIGYILSIIACIGAVTLIFQNGHFDSLLGTARAGPILSFLPVLLIGVLFGLAMDYEVFLVSRMREEHTHGAKPRRAIIDGNTGSAKVVGSAGIIMIAVFAAFILAPDPTTKSFGVSLALGVLIDAFVVRMTLVPAAMSLFRNSAWWLPRRLARVLPNIDVEGDQRPAPKHAAVASGIS
jgi:RND superfamily putative drug exporter